MPLCYRVYLGEYYSFHYYKYSGTINERDNQMKTCFTPKTLQRLIYFGYFVRIFLHIIYIFKCPINNLLLIAIPSHYRVYLSRTMTFISLSQILMQIYIFINTIE